MTTPPSYLETIAPIIGKAGVMEIVQTSERDARKQLVLLDEAVDLGDLGACRHHLHAIKGIALNLGMRGLASRIIDSTTSTITDARLLHGDLFAILDEELRQAVERLKLDQA